MTQKRLFNKTSQRKQIILLITEGQDGWTNFNGFMERHRESTTTNLKIIHQDFNKPLPPYFASRKKMPVYPPNDAFYPRMAEYFDILVETYNTVFAAGVPDPNGEGQRQLALYKSSRDFYAGF